jgi:polyisoprenoid-binding protein YceI
MLKRNYLLTCLCLGTILFSGCAQKPDAEKAEVTDAHQVPEGSGKAETLPVIPERSTVTWIGAKVTGNHNGTINLKEGNLQLNGRKIEGGSFTFDMPSLRATDLEMSEEDNKKLTGHLLSPDFFDVARHPTATFVITEAHPLSSVELKDEAVHKRIIQNNASKQVEEPTHEIAGNLTIKGITKGIRFPAKVHFTHDTVRTQANFMINRSDWNLNYMSEQSLGNKMIYPEMNIGLDIAAARK